MNRRPPPPSTAPPPPQQQADAPTTTLHVSVRRVALDISVTDAKGHPVPGLKQSDFTVYEDGKPQPIRTFGEEKFTPSPPPEHLALPPNTFANLANGTPSGPTTVILYDVLNTPQDSQAYAHEQLLRFLRNRAPGAQTAVFVLSDRLHMLAGFTDDDEKLIQAVSAKNTRPYRSTWLQQQGEATSGSDALARTEGNQNGSDAQPDLAYQQVATMLQHMETAETSYLMDRRVEITADALQEIARFLIDQPGRKNLLWLSGSFPSGILPDPDADSRDQFQVTRNYTELIVAATDMLTASHVAVYPVDIRGLQANSMYAAGANIAFEPGQHKDNKAVRDFSQDIGAEHQVMDKIADATGGHAFYNTNGLAQAEASAEEEGSLYYTLSYAPTKMELDGKLRHVRVDLKRPGLRLAYRRTYFADDLDKKAQDAADHTDDALAGALKHGAPIVRDLVFEAHVETEGQPVQATPAQIEELLHYESLATRNAHRAIDPNKPLLLQRYVVQFILLPRQLDIRMGADELRHDNLEVAAISYDEDGMALNGLRTRLQDAIHNDRWGMMLREGYHVPMALLVPVQARSLRLAVEDAGNSHFGSIELALPLPKLPAPAPPQPAPPGH